MNECMGECFNYSYFLTINKTTRFLFQLSLHSWLLLPRLSSLFDSLPCSLSTPRRQGQGVAGHHIFVPSLKTTAIDDNKSAEDLQGKQRDDIRAHERGGAEKGEARQSNRFVDSLKGKQKARVVVGEGGGKVQCIRAHSVFFLPPLVLFSSLYTNSRNSLTRSPTTTRTQFARRLTF